jgi:protein-tyrosine kinase
MFRRRSHPPVLAEISAPRDGSPRPGALGRGELDAFAQASRKLAGSSAVQTTGGASTTAALGLATAAAAEGRRVALLECDLTAPALAVALGLASGPGLNEYLRGEKEASQILQSLVLAGPASARATAPLVCIVAGEPAGSAASLLSSDGFRHAIGKLRRAYDLLVVDGPPLDGGDGAMEAVAKSMDATIACGARAEIPRRLPRSVTGLVIQG